MTKCDIEKIKDHKNLILLAEIGALIHDLGKLSKLFIDKHTREKENDPILGNYHHGNILKYDSDPNSNFYPNDDQLKDLSKKLITLLNQIPINIDNHSSKLYLLLEKHHNYRDFPNEIVKMINIADSFDSGEDRGNASDKQSICNTYFSNAFGYEKEISLTTKKDFEKERKIVYDLIIDFLNTCSINKIEKKRKHFLEQLRNSFSKTLGMTARAANDVTLWEHSYMTASILKSILSSYYLKQSFPKSKNGIRIKIYSISWNFFDFISQSHKIPDVIGRIETINEIKSKIKNIFEVKYALGNCIYEDDFGVHFLLPAILKENDLEPIKKQIIEIFNDKTNGILIPAFTLSKKTKSLKEIIGRTIKESKEKSLKRKIPFKPSWVCDWGSRTPSKSKLVCNVCGKGFYYEGAKEEICDTCKYIRQRGRIEEHPQTIFIDEVAWNSERNQYANVALLTINFDLENWLNGFYVNSLFMRKYDENKIKLLFDYYNNGEQITRSFIQQGALKGWIKGLSPEAQNKAKASIENCIKRYDQLEDFSKSYLRDLYFILKDIERALDSNNNKEANSLLNKLNNEANKIENSVKQTEDKILNPDPRFKNKEKEIIKNSSNLEEIKKRIFLKNPSPSRLMRVWNNTKEFFKHLEKDICEESFLIDRYVLELREKQDIRENRAWEVEIEVEDNKRKGEIVFEGNLCITVTPHINDFIEKNKNKELQIKITDKEWTQSQKEFHGKFKEKRRIKGYRIISISPTLFLCLVPTEKIFEIIKKIREQFIQKFGKVYGKLPLNIGIIFFKRKTPFFTVLDSSKRYIENFGNKVLKEKKNLDILRKFEEKDLIILETEIGKIKVPHKLGDGTEDYYHPYIEIIDKSNSNIISSGVDNENIIQKHISCLKEKDTTSIHPSYFDFEFLDTNTRRFDIILDNGKRPHRIFNKGPRPYYLEEIDAFQELWNILCGKNKQRKKLTSSQINNFQTLLVSKIEEWDLRNLNELKNNDNFKKLVEDSIIRILGIHKKIKKDDQLIENLDFKLIKQSVLSGLFFDVIELFMTIMKGKCEEVSE